VFPLLEWPTYKAEDIDLRSNEKLERLISFDLGIKNDPTVISFFFPQSSRRNYLLAQTNYYS